MNIDGDHAGWYATATGFLVLLAGALGLRLKKSGDDVQIAKNNAERRDVETAQQELQRLRRSLEDCRTENAGLKADNAHLSIELMNAQHLASRYMESLAERAGTRPVELDDIPRPPPKRRT